MKIEQVHRSFESWVYPISKIVNRIASGVLFCMMLLTIADVFLRKVFSQSILGTVEVTEFMMVILLFFAVTQTEILDGHVRVDLIMSRFGERTQTLVDTITQLVCFLLFGLFTWSTLVYAAKMRASGEVSQDLWLPVYPFIYVVALGCALLALSLLIKSFMAYMRMIKS
ncbi:MAG: TRAP transporter small permease subunit [Desulfobacterales bacterium]|nr:TRAP transporter small permease subunit [Desulfobacterales bacterium]